jgi:type I restriction enzyme S subunit
MTGEVLPENWRWSTLGEVAAPNPRAIVSGPFGSNIGSRFFVEKGVPVIRGNNLTTDMRRFIDAGFVFVSEDKADELGNCDAVIDDLVFTAAGSLGQVGIVPKTATYPRYIISNKQLRARVDNRKVEPLFAFYWFSSKEMVEYIQQRNTGSSVPLINLGVLRSLPIPVPPLDEQRAIAYILGTLDDKIELNRRMGETLEAMARALFKSWFVDFDPVRAKAEGRDPVLPKPLANLFPARLVDSELGEIPEGWGVGRFGDVAAVCRDQDNPLEFPNELFSHYSIPAFDEGQTPRLEYGETIKSLKLRVSAGAVLLSKLNPEIERVWLVDVRPDDRAVCSTEFLVLQARPPFARAYVYCLTRSPLFRQQIEGLVTGTSKSHQRAQAGSILNLGVVVAPTPIVEAFERSVASMLARTLECRHESETLTALRDTLLPKLMSGKLPVSGA